MPITFAPEILRAAHAQLVQNAMVLRAVDAGLDAARALTNPAGWAAHLLVPGRPKPPLQRAAELHEALRITCEAWLYLRQGRFARKPHVSTTQTVRERALIAVRNAVHDAWSAADYKRSGTTWAGGEHTTTVSIGAPSAYGHSKRVYSSNGKWPGTNTGHSVTVPLRWRVAVERQGIAVVDGLFTLDAHPIDDNTLAARWVTQGRGFALNLVGGVLRRDGETWRHDASKKAQQIYQQTQLRKD